MDLEATEKTPTILIVDNDDGVLAAIATRLQFMGYRCVTAVTGAQGVSLFQQEKIDLVITDLNMPAMDGVGVVRKIRELRADKGEDDVPCIILTGFRREYSQALRHLRGVTVVEKPCRARDLIDMVETELFLGPCSHAA